MNAGEGGRLAGFGSRANRAVNEKPAAAVQADKRPVAGLEDRRDMKSSNQNRTKVAIAAFTASILFGALSFAAIAQNYPLATTDNYLSSHPEVAQQLNQNPKLIDNPQYIAQHPGLHQYLEKHPHARHEWRSHPYRYMRHEGRYQQTH